MSSDCSVPLAETLTWLVSLIFLVLEILPVKSLLWQLRVQFLIGKFWSCAGCGNSFIIRLSCNVLFVTMFFCQRCTMWVTFGWIFFRLNWCFWLFYIFNCISWLTTCGSVWHWRAWLLVWWCTDFSDSAFCHNQTCRRFCFWSEESVRCLAVDYGFTVARVWAVHRWKFFLFMDCISEWTSDSLIILLIW